MNVEQFSKFVRENVDPEVIVTPFARGIREPIIQLLPNQYPESARGHALAYAVSYVNTSSQDVTALVVGDRHKIVLVDGEFVADPDPDLPL